MSAVIPAHAGIQAVQRSGLKLEYLINELDSRLRGNDGYMTQLDFLEGSR
jgi:hypothetical protein